jgi:hypothetical protein
MERPIGNATETYIACAIAVSALGACASQVDARAQRELLGMSKKELLSCAGTPHRQDRVEDWEYLTYVGGGNSNGDASAVQTPPSTAPGPRASNQPYCEATFLVKDGVVARVNYQSRTGGVTTKGEPCEFLIEKCVRR